MLGSDPERSHYFFLGLQNEQLSGDVFICLLEEVTKVRKAVKLEETNALESPYEASEYQMLLLQTVITASERLGSAILKRPGKNQDASPSFLFFGLESLFFAVFDSSLA